MIAYTDKHVQPPWSVHSVASTGFVTLVLHYMLTPAESNTSPLAIVIRLAIVLSCAGVVAALTLDRNRWSFLIPFIFSICVWILLLNFPATTWYVLIFAGLVGASLASSMAFSNERTRALFVTSLNWLLCFWIGIFLIQFFIYLYFGTVVDFHQILHPYSEARLMGVMQERIFRLSGAHIEPGTYANWVYGAILLRSLATRRLFDTFNLFVMLTIVLTYSFWGTLAAAIFVAAAVVSSLTSLRLSTLVKVVGALLFFYSATVMFQPTIIGDVAEYIVSRAELDDGSGHDKVQAYRGFAEEFWRVLAIGTPITFNFCNGCESPEDAGLFINLVMRMGLITTLGLFGAIGLALYRIGGVAGVMVVVPLLFVKYFYYEPMFWMIFGVALLNGHLIRDAGAGREGTGRPVQNGVISRPRWVKSCGVVFGSDPEKR